MRARNIGTARRAAVVVVGLSSLLVAACGDDSAASSTTAKAAAGATAASATTGAAGSVASVTTVSSSGSSGGANDKFCAAVKDMSTIAGSSGGDLSSVRSKLNDVADRIKSTAPSEISQAAATYAALLKVAASNAKDASAIGASLASGITAERAADYGKFITYITTHCGS